MRLAPEDPALGEGDAAHGSDERGQQAGHHRVEEQRIVARLAQVDRARDALQPRPRSARAGGREGGAGGVDLRERSEEHTSELQSQSNLVCRLLLEKKKKKKTKEGMQN